MKSKKIASLILSAVMTMSLAVPALATGNETGSLSQKTEITGTTQAPTIKITVPDAGGVTVNPYKMEVEVDGEKLTDQIISATNYIKNESDVAIKVSAEVTGKPAAKVTLATATTQGTKAVTTKSVFMYFEIGTATKDDGSGDPAWAQAYDSKAATQILVSNKAVKKADMLTMGAGADTATIAGFRLTGDAASAPTEAWTAEDKVDVSVAFTFIPTVTPAAGN